MPKQTKKSGPTSVSQRLPAKGKHVGAVKGGAVIVTCVRPNPGSQNAMAALRRLLVELRRARTTPMALYQRLTPVPPERVDPDTYGVFDPRTRCRFFFHAHDGKGEGGHFHTERFFDDHTVHVVAIAVSRAGEPEALFTINHWAAGDRAKSPPLVKRYARAFRIDERRGEPRLVRFVNLVYRAFLPEILRLQDEKVALLAAHRPRRRGVHAHDDRSLQFLSEMRIAVPTR